MQLALTDSDITKKRSDERNAVLELIYSEENTPAIIIQCKYELG